MFAAAERPYGSGPMASLGPSSLMGPSSSFGFPAIPSSSPSFSPFFHHHHQQHHPGHYSPPMVPPLSGSPPPMPSRSSLPFQCSPHSISSSAGNSPPPAMRLAGIPPLVSLSSGGSLSTGSSSSDSGGFSSPERAAMGGAGAGGMGMGPKSEALRDLEDPQYYSMPTHAAERQIVVLTSRIKERVPALCKTRWLDQQLSYRQCPYPIEFIEFTHAGDAVVQFISEAAMAKVLARPPLQWGTAGQEIGTRPCTEDDIAALFWVGLLGVPSDLLPSVRQALQPYGEVRGEYAPHPSTVDPLTLMPSIELGGLNPLNGSAPEFVPGFGLRGDGCSHAARGPGHGSPVRGGPLGGGAPAAVGPPSPCVSPSPVPPTPSSSSGMLKLYFAPSGRRRIPPTIHFHRLDRPKGFPPVVARVFTPHGPLAPKCADFGPAHSSIGCPECARRGGYA